MKIVIAGGTGFIGRALVDHYLAQNNDLMIIGRNKEKIATLFGDKVKALSWDDLNREGGKLLDGADLIINLSGANIGEKRWNKQRKQNILLSRIKSTETLARICAKLSRPPTLFNASAVGVYGLQEDTNNNPLTILDENTPINFNSAPDFLAHVGRQWELATHIASRANVRVVNLRFGIVLGKGGVLAKLKPLYLLGLGGQIGSGKQFISWIALTDLVRIIDFIYEHPEITGPVNCVAPECITQKEFAKKYAKALNRPAWGFMPAFVVNSLFGQMGEELLLKGQCITPTLLINNHFNFLSPTLDVALRDIFNP